MRLVLYTVVFAIPFIFVIFHAYRVVSGLDILTMRVCLSSLLSLPLSLVVLLAFAVKLPVYGLHF